MPLFDVFDVIADPPPAAIDVYSGVPGETGPAGPAGPAATIPPDLVVGSSVAIGTNPAQSGAVRLANGQSIKTRNIANTGDTSLLALGEYFIVGEYLVAPPIFIDSYSQVALRAGAMGQLLLEQNWLSANVPLSLSKTINFKKTTAPAAPPGNEANLWLQDNGAGKSQLMIQFATGAAIQIAIQP